MSGILSFQIRIFSPSREGATSEEKGESFQPSLAESWLHMASSLHKYANSFACPTQGTLLPARELSYEIR